MQKPQVTIVVSPRERFSYTKESLESIYEHTQIPFKLYQSEMKLSKIEGE
jgi:hypothetical protein